MDTTVDARPTKSFFVDMLTRDISVTAAILDLCDNALGRTFALATLDPCELLRVVSLADAGPHGQRTYLLLLGQ